MAAQSKLKSSTPGLDLFCAHADATAPGAGSALRRLASDSLRRLKPGEYLARHGEVAEATWIIERGEIDVAAPRLKIRSHGDLIGEAGLLSPGSTRACDLQAQTTAEVWCISRAAVQSLCCEDRAAVFAAIATVLHNKLQQTIEQRHEQLADAEASEDLLRAFVPDSGLLLIRARLRGEPATPRIHRATPAIVWFSDIAGFSALTKTMSPEEAGQAAQDLQEPIIAAIAKRGGELDKLMGDGAMAFWLCDNSGISEACTGEAVEAAIAAARETAALAEKRNWNEVGVRIGLHCGDVLIGDFGAHGRRSYTAIGSTVNIAARYEQARESQTGEMLGPVRISPEIYTHLPSKQQKYFEAEPLLFKEKSPPMLKVHRLRENIIGDLK